MARERRSGGRSTKAGRSGGGIHQLPAGQITNPNPPVELASPEQMQKLHDTSMRILSELGIRVMSDKIMNLFEKAGAIVDREASIIRMDESLVMNAVASASFAYAHLAQPSKKADNRWQSPLFRFGRWTAKRSRLYQWTA